jgi:uncharacterized membrane protein
MKRNYTLDIVRTLAIVLMVIFHFLYDLKFFGYVDWDTPDGSGWREFRWLIISLFFVCLGVSLAFAHSIAYRWQKFGLRLGQISAAAALISIATYFAIHANWIFFGVLHFLAFASVVAIAFVSRPKLSFIIGLTIISIGLMQLVPSRWPFYLFSNNLPSYTNDFVALFPWLGLVFLGITLAHTQWFKNDPLRDLINNSLNDKAGRYIVWPGQHSLSIYLLHQPILMGSLYLISLL